MIFAPRGEAKHRTPPAAETQSEESRETPASTREPTAADKPTQTTRDRRPAALLRSALGAIGLVPRIVTLTKRQAIGSIVLLAFAMEKLESAARGLPDHRLSPAGSEISREGLPRHRLFRSAFNM